VLDVYKDDKVLTMLFANKFNKIDKKFKAWFEEIYSIYYLRLITKHLKQK